MRVFLDDIRDAPPGWELVKTPAECIARLKREPVVHVLSLDHDLGIDPAKFEAYTVGDVDEWDAEITGKEVVRWMIENHIWPARACIVHSSNPVGAKRMCQDIDRYGPYTTPVQWLDSWNAYPEIVEALDAAFPIC